MNVQSDDQATRHRAQFALIARGNEADMLRAARRLCRGDEDWASDLVQDALIRAYKAYMAGQFEIGSHPRPWLLRILTNLFINDYHRRQKREQGPSVEAMTAETDAVPEALRASTDDAPGVRLMNSVLDEEIETALSSLPEPMRQCVILVDIEGLDYAEAADALKVPVGTIRSRLSRARMRLEDLLLSYARQRGYAL